MIRGVFIFAIFIWKPTIWKAIKETHPRLGRFLSSIFKSSPSFAKADGKFNGDEEGESPVTRPATEATSCLIEVNKNDLVSHRGQLQTSASMRRSTVKTEIEEEIEIEINNGPVVSHQRVSSVSTWR